MDTIKSWMNYVIFVRTVRKWLMTFEENEKERTGIKGLKIGYNRVFGYYIEVTKAICL